MEPIDLNSSDPSDQALDALLRKGIAPPLPDAGFSARVLAALPPPKEKFLRPREWLGLGLLAAGALVLGPPGRLLEKMRTETSTLGDAVAPLFTVLADPALLLVLAISAGVWLVISDDEETAFESPPMP